MSSALYDVAADAGNWGAKFVRDNQHVVIRNVAVPYNGSEDELTALGLFGSDGLETIRREGDVETTSMRIGFGGRLWIVGEAAYRMNVMAREQTTFARYGTDEWFALIAASLTALYKKRSGAVGMTFSMPVSQFRAGMHHKVREMLIGMWEVDLDDRLLTFEIREDMLDMLPEGFGSLCHQILSTTGKSFINRDLAEGRIVVFDFGGYTLDVTTYDGLNIGAYNDSLTTGLIHVRNTVNRELKRRYNRTDASAAVLDRVIRTKQYQHKGGPPEDVSDIVDAAIVNLIQDAVRVWNEELAGGEEYTHVIITGGGGPVIGSLLEPQLGFNGPLIIIPEGEAHLANALGALKYRKFKRLYSEA
ncbi:MAG: hypothetical protein ACFB51_21265 [Anaerolineae bacterium]